MAEHFRDVLGQDVLLFIDNIFRFVQAGSEVSALLGRIPSAVGYQPTLANEIGALEERITSTKKGSITSVQAVYVPADDLTDPAPATTFTHLDATTVLSRRIVEKGIYPSVDPLASSSRILDPRVVGEEHYAVATRVQEILQRYQELQDIIAILGMDELGPRTSSRSTARARSSASSRSPSTSPSSSPACPAAMSPSRTRSGASRRSPTASATRFPSRPSSWQVQSRKSASGRKTFKEWSMPEFNCEILTPYRRFFSGKAESVTFVTHDGQIEILAMHESLVLRCESGS